MILEKHEAYRSSPNYIVIKVEGEDRDINIHNYGYTEICLAKLAELELKKGFFGFYLIKGTKLTY